ncbi:Heavy metal-associated domain, HMA [Cynara cardunculus var. scolymus]|uniref:Heavy metal-associated domain, HMA n=1 Tax=Cynara cardunculus var. scolymus TaxID=59895 RepID=A0A103Y9S2_CYNCS|nr:Heavy metal-associated domain, HMA [Cynara cardunculus var. scolymus]
MSQKLTKFLLMGMQTVVLKVGMSCGGCVGAVKRVLGKMEGLLIRLSGNVQPDAVLQTVSKTGKKTEFWPAEAAATSVA